MNIIILVCICLFIPLYRKLVQSSPSYFRLNSEYGGRRGWVTRLTFDMGGGVKPVFLSFFLFCLHNGRVPTSCVQGSDSWLAEYKHYTTIHHNKRSSFMFSFFSSYAASSQQSGSMCDCDRTCKQLQGYHSMCGMWLDSWLGLGHCHHCYCCSPSAWLFSA